MAIRTKTNQQLAVNEDAGGEETPRAGFSNNPEINRAIDQRISARPKDFAYYTKLSVENPERLVRVAIYKDHEADHRAAYAILKNLDVAKAWYEAQPEEARAKIEAKLRSVHPYYADKELAKYVVNEIGQRGIAEFAETKGIRTKAG